MDTTRIKAQMVLAAARIVRRWQSEQADREVTQDDAAELATLVDQYGIDAGMTASEANDLAYEAAVLAIDARTR